MIEIVLGILIAGILIFLLIKAIGNILKGMFLLFLAFLIYYFLISSLPSLNFSLQPIGNFLRAPIDRVKNIFYNLEIVTVSNSKNNLLIIVIKNNGFLPLSHFNVRIDGKEVKIINNINILLPKQIGVLEIDWNGNYSKIEVFAKETRATFISPL